MYRYEEDDKSRDMGLALNIGLMIWFLFCTICYASMKSYLSMTACLLLSLSNVATIVSRRYRNNYNGDYDNLARIFNTASTIVSIIAFLIIIYAKAT